MNQVLTIENKTLLPIREAATHVTYSKDYITRLAREGKITARWIGRQWFVELSSLKTYEESARIEQEVRKQRLSVERKQERDLREALSLQQAREDAQVSSLQHVADAVLVSGGVMVVGVLCAVVASTTGLFGVSVFVPTQTAAVSGAQSQLITHTNAGITETVVPQFVLPHTVVATSTAAIVLVPDGAAAGMATVTDYFSDTVLSRTLSDGTQVLVARNASGTEAVLPFVSVPVEATTTTATHVNTSYE